MRARGRELAAAGDEWRWPTGHTAAELDAVELDATESEALAVLLRHGRSWVFNHYRRQLRAVGLSWIGIPTAELTSEDAQRRMARVLVLISRSARDVKAGYTFTVPCRFATCRLDYPHEHELTLTLH